MRKILNSILSHPVWSGIGAIAGVIALILAFKPEPVVLTRPDITSTYEVPSITIRVDESNKIHRTILDNESKWNPTWVVKKNGEIVIEVNAIGNSSYRYFRKDPGVYTVYVKAWVKDHYQPISNIETYTIH